MTRARLDARRLLCPLPVIRVQDCVKTLPPGAWLDVVATDPGAAQDIPVWCRLNGHKVESLRVEGYEVRITIEVGGG